MNRVFDRTGVSYGDRPPPRLKRAYVKRSAPQPESVATASDSEKAKRIRRAVAKQKISKAEDVRLGMLLAKPVGRKSRKVSFDLQQDLVGSDGKTG